MSAQGWVIDLNAVAANGDAVQLYPAWVSAGANYDAASTGDKIRQPNGGNILAISVKSDEVNGGLIELWDADGRDIGADVSSSNVITDAQLNTLISQGKAKRIWAQNFAAAPGSVIPGDTRKDFTKGLVARFSNSGPSGNCTLNLSVVGGYRKVEARK